MTNIAANIPAATWRTKRDVRGSSGPLQIFKGILKEIFRTLPKHANGQTLCSTSFYLETEAQLVTPMDYFLVRHICKRCK